MAKRKRQLAKPKVHEVKQNQVLDNNLIGDNNVQVRTNVSPQFIIPLSINCYPQFGPLQLPVHPYAPYPYTSPIVHLPRMSYLQGGNWGKQN